MTTCHELFIRFRKKLFIWFTARAFDKLLSIYVFSYFPFGFEGRMWDLIVSVPDHCLFGYFPFGFEGRMWDLIVSVPDHCLSFYFTKN